MDKPDENKILLFPEFAELKEEIAKLQVELSMLVLERDELQFHQCKTIEMAYLLGVGAVEYKIFETQCVILRLKRKIEMIQAKLNRQEKIDVAHIDDLLEQEFEKYQAELNARTRQINAALERSQGHLLTEEEDRELKKMYRLIVKALHPDLHPEVSGEKLQLFYNAVEIYQNGDLGGLQVIATMIGDLVIPEGKTDDLRTIKQEKDRLLEMVQKVKDKIVEIKGEYPYTMKDLVENPKEMAERKAQLEEELDQLKEMAKLYQSRIAQMIRR